ncbi:MAG: site-specific DNA-methyltransferase [Proteobacteria bacterium]|nr:site-specific DNA-methyltransferase [Pseudomonadota bacterium]
MGRKTKKPRCWTAKEGDLRLIEADVSDALKLIDDGSIQLVLTSPPYNLRKIYERDRVMSLDEYVSWLDPIVGELCKKVGPKGSICWQVGNFVDQGAVYPLDYYFYGLFLKYGFKLRNRIIWKFNFGLHAKRRFSGRYETVLWLTKSDDYTFNLDPVRVPQLYPGKRHSSSKGTQRAGTPSGNPLGKNPSDYWTFTPEENFFLDPIWDIPNVKANHPELTDHPCQFPHELAERFVLALTKSGDVVLDPFVGAGTSAIAAIKLGRKSVAIDRCKEYVELTKKRVKKLRVGSIKLRKSGQEVREPNVADRVARPPAEWIKMAAE